MKKNSSHALLLISLLACAVPVRAANPVHSVVEEVKRYGRDAKDLVTAPARWRSREWKRFGAGVALVVATYALDDKIYDAVQRNRTDFTDDFAEAITPFGGGRATQITVLMIAAGSLSDNINLRDAGRDALESEIFASGIITPALKRLAGRARPNQGEGSSSFHPFDRDFHSFPSGHATTAFAMATAVASHYDGWIVPTIAYTVASSVAISRVNDQAHFPSDVVAGALIGRAVAKGLVYRHQHGRTTTTLMPAVNNGRPGFAMRVSWQ